MHSYNLPPDGTEQSGDGAALWRHAKKLISCGTGLLSKRASSFDEANWPAYYSRCSGCEVWDLEGRRHIDFVGGVGAILLGYADPDVTEAVRAELGRGTYCTLLNPREVALAERLLELHPWAGKVRYARGGGDAMAVAVRVARAATGRSGVAVCGYHGWHDWYLAANLGETGALDGHLLPGLQPLGVPRELYGTASAFVYNDETSLVAALDQLGDNLAAVVMEPMRSQFPRDGFLAKAAALCRRRGGVFVVDEITSGLRYGFPGACARLGVEPDLVVYAKALSNGFPFGAVVGRAPVMEAAEPSFISSSHWTDAIGPAAALAVLAKAARENAQEQVWERGGLLQEGLRRIAERHPASGFETGGMPASPRMAFRPGPQAAKAQLMLVREMLQRGFLVSSLCYVMLAHDAACIALLLEALDDSVAAVAKAAGDGRLDRIEAGSPGGAGFARLA